MKKALLLLLIFMLSLALLAACGQPAEEGEGEPEAAETETETAEEGGTRTIVDMTGHEVEIPAEVNTYVESWFAHNAVDLMLDKAEGMLITCASPEQHPWMYTVCPNFWNAQSVKFATDMSLEEIIAADPDVVFGSNEDFREMFEAVGLPFINCSFKTYDEMIQAVKLTAEVFGGDAIEVADAWANYLQERLDWVSERVADIPDEERVRVAHGSSIYELDFDGANTLIDEWITYSGAINAAAEGLEGNLQTISLEQVIEWDPDVLITGRPHSQVEEVLNDPAWAALTAVKNGKVYSNPRGIFAWDRYGVEEALQPQWCASLLYPDRFEDFDIKEEVKYFYKEFLGYELTDEEAQMILNYEAPTLTEADRPAA